MQLPLLPGATPVVNCPYCPRQAELMLDSSPLYHGRNYGPVWICKPCEAWVGVHKNSPRHLPLGRLADAELRAAKVAAHALFDPLWQRKLIRSAAPRGKEKKRARVDGYHWLAEQLGIAYEDCHIGYFDVETCKRVVEICKPFHPSMGAKAEGPVASDVRIKKPEKKKRQYTPEDFYSA